MLGNFLSDFFVSVVSEPEDCRLKRLVENGSTRELIDLLFLDWVGWDCHDFATADQYGASNLSVDRFEKRDRAAIESDGQDITTDGEIGRASCRERV